MKLEDIILHDLKLRVYPHASLSKKCDAVLEEFGTFELEILCGKMLNIMKAFEGIGLAANQVGIFKRIFVFENGIEDGLERPADIPIPEVFINPRIEINKDTIEHSFKEGCLSFPTIYTNVKRYEFFTLHYQDIEGNHHSLGPEICNGFFGHAFQHEIDHLDGLTMLERVDKIEYGRIIKKVNKLRRKK